MFGRGSQSEDIQRLAASPFRGPMVLSPFARGCGNSHTRTARSSVATSDPHRRYTVEYTGQNQTQIHSGRTVVSEKNIHRATSDRVRSFCLA